MLALSGKSCQLFRAFTTNNGASTFETLYETNKPMSYEEARESAQQKGLYEWNVTPPQKVYAAAISHLITKNPGLTAQDFTWAYYPSKGQCLPFRIKVEIPQPSWGSSSSAELNSVLIYNVLTQQVYFIGMAEFYENWHIADGSHTIEADGNGTSISYHARLQGYRMLEKLPILTAEEFFQMLK
jgi:hypothetical protein